MNAGPHWCAAAHRDMMCDMGETDIDWISVGTLFASLVAAVGAVWAVVISQKQLDLAAAATGPSLPVVEADMREVRGHPGWTEISVVMRNTAPIAIDLLGVTILRPKNTRLLLYADAYESAGVEWTAGAMKEPLPAELTALTVNQTGYMTRAGTPHQHGSGPVDSFTVYAHCPISRLIEDPEPRLSLEMRWRDHTTKTFAMAVNVIKPRMA